MQGVFLVSPNGQPLVCKVDKQLTRRHIHAQNGLDNRALRTAKGAKTSAEMVPLVLARGHPGGASTLDQTRPPHHSHCATLFLDQEHGLQ